MKSIQVYDGDGVKVRYTRRSPKTPNLLCNYMGWDHTGRDRDLICIAVTFNATRGRLPLGWNLEHIIFTHDSQGIELHLENVRNRLSLAAERRDGFVGLRRVVYCAESAYCLDRGKRSNYSLDGSLTLVV